MKNIVMVSVLMLIGAFSISANAGSHYVRGYTTKSGSYHQAHRAGNPKSGTHCKGSVCG